MTTISGVIDFSAAPAGWQAAIAQGDSEEIVLVPIIGWARQAADDPVSLEMSPVEPVVLFDNTREPIITPLGKTLQDWNDGSRLHQILAPGVTVRDVPAGWAVRVYAG